MSKVKQYDLHQTYLGASMEEREYGDYVKSDDYEQLLAENERIEQSARIWINVAQMRHEENEGLKDENERLKQENEFVKSFNALKQNCIETLGIEVAEREEALWKCSPCDKRGVCNHCGMLNWHKDDCTWVRLAGGAE